MLMQQHGQKKITAVALAKKPNHLDDIVKACLEKGYRRILIEKELGLSPSAIYSCYKRIGFSPIGIGRIVSYIKPVKIEWSNGEVKRYMSRNEASIDLGISPRYVGMLIESGKVHKKGYRLYND